MFCIYFCKLIIMFKGVNFNMFLHIMKQKVSVGHHGLQDSVLPPTQDSLLQQPLTPSLQTSLHKIFVRGNMNKLFHCPLPKAGASDTNKSDCSLHPRQTYCAGMVFHDWMQTCFFRIQAMALVWATGYS